MRRPVSGFDTTVLKVAQLDGEKEKVSLEYEDCKKIAEKFCIPLREVLTTIR